MLYTLLALLLWFQAPIQRVPFPPVSEINLVQGPFTVQVARAGRNTLVGITYPPTDNVWSCVVSRRADRSDTYEPRWCGWVDTPSEVVTIPNWPPNDGHDWEVMVFVQWKDSPNQSKDFGYRESEWQVIP